MRISLYLSLMLSPLLACSVWASPPRPTYPADLQPDYANLRYAPRSPSQTLDLFLPKGPGPFPLVINIHGGAFRFGGKEMLDAPIARELLKANIAVASINYRLSAEARFPAAIQDAKAAVRFLRAQASAYRLNPERFLAFGQSAGGNLASLLGTSSHETAFDDPALGHAAVSSRVQGVIDWFGPSDFLRMDQDAKAQGCPADSQTHGQADSPESRYLGQALAQVPQLATAASPVAHVHPDAPPFLLQKGERDCIVPVGQSRRLYAALKKAGVAVTLDILPEAGHGDMGSPRPIFLSPQNIQRVIGFVRKTLK